MENEDRYDPLFSKFKKIESFRDLCDQYRQDPDLWYAWFSTLCNWYGRINQDMSKDETETAKNLEKNISFALLNKTGVSSYEVFTVIRKYEVLLEEVSDRILRPKAKKKVIRG